MNPPLGTVPEQFGLCFNGNESAFCSALDVAIAAHRNRAFHYVEIGIAYGQCLRSVGAYLSERGIDFAITGVDLPECGEAANPANYPWPSRVQVFTGGSEDYLRGAMEAETKIDFAFIDGCHGAPCVRRDFLGVERVIAPYGVVCFHDTDQGCQDLHWQPHCSSGIRARTAVKELGLLDDTRKGWVKIGETTGDKSKGGHGCLFVQYVG